MGEIAKITRTNWKNSNDDDDDDDDDLSKLIFMF